MEMDIDKSEDELELERLVFGDSEGIKEQLRGSKGIEKERTDLEHLEDDQVGPLHANFLTLVILHRLRRTEC